MIRVNRYKHNNGKWYWRVWRGAVVIARGAAGFKDPARLERDLALLFPLLVKRRR